MPLPTTFIITNKKLFCCVSSSFPILLASLFSSLKIYVAYLTFHPFYLIGTTGKKEECCYGLNHLPGVQVWIREPVYVVLWRDLHSLQLIRQSDSQLCWMGWIPQESHSKLLYTRV